MTELKKKVNTCSTPINFQTSQMAMTPDEIKIIKRKTKNPSLWHFTAGYVWTIVPILGYGGFVTNFISTEETEMPNYFILANTIHCNRIFRSRNIRSLNWRPVCVTHQNVSFGSCCILNTTYLYEALQLPLIAFRITLYYDSQLCDILHFKYGWQYKPFSDMATRVSD